MIISDLDDTLLNSDAAISPRTENALRAARALGAEIVFASGRMTRAMRPYATQLDITAPMISFNGGEVSDPVTGKVMFSLPVEAALAREAARMAELMGLHIQAYYDDEYYFEAENQYSALYARAIGVPGIPVHEKLSKHIGKDCIKLLLIDQPENITKLRPVFVEALGDRLSMVISRPKYIEFTALSATKGNALARLAPMMNIKPEEIVAFGDGQNDLSMLHYAGLGYAPANAHPDVLEQSPNRMPSNDEDGVAQVIEALIDDHMIGGAYAQS